MEEQFIVKAGYKINKKKFDYFFGKAGISEFGNVINQHNYNRSTQIRDVLRGLRIEDTPEGREKLCQIFQDALEGEEVYRGETKYGITIRRKYFRAGIQLQIGYFYREGNLGSIPEITTIIPKL
jgi:hypothetical protein